MPAGWIALTLLFSSSLAFGAGDKFEVVSEKQVEAIPAASGLVALSPDGKSALLNDNGGLILWTLDSPDEKRLLPQGSLPPTSRWVAWSPDGKWIYYPQGASKPWTNDLWRLEIATLKRSLVIKDVGGTSTPSPRPAPDGKSIAFFRGKSLMLAGADGQNERLLWDNCDAGWNGMTWSPDGTQILVPTGPNPYVNGVTKLSLFAVSTKQVKLLTPWQGAATSIVWPAWSSGPFLCVRPIDPRRRNGSPPTAQIWQWSLPQRQADQEERTQLTREPANYFRILGAGTDGYSLVAQRFLPPPGVWDSIVNFFANALAPQGRFQASLVTLTLKK